MQKKLCPEFKLLTCYLSPRRELCPGPGQTTCPEPAGWKTTEILKKEKIKNCQPDQPVQSLTLGQSKVLIPPTKTARIRISLKSVLGVEKKTLLKYSLLFWEQCNLHPPDDNVYSVWGGLYGGLKVEGWEGNVFHREVGLEGVGDVLVAWNVIKLIMKTTYKGYSIYQASYLQ